MSAIITQGQMFCVIVTRHTVLDISLSSKWKTSSSHHCRLGLRVTSLSIDDSKLEI